MDIQEHRALVNEYVNTRFDLNPEDPKVLTITNVDHVAVLVDAIYARLDDFINNMNNAYNARYILIDLVYVLHETAARLDIACILERIDRSERMGMIGYIVYFSSNLDYFKQAVCVDGTYKGLPMGKYNDIETAGHMLNGMIRLSYIMGCSTMMIDMDKMIKEMHGRKMDELFCYSMK